jgi:hypothetical protein
MSLPGCPGVSGGVHSGELVVVVVVDVVFVKVTVFVIVVVKVVTVSAGCICIGVELALWLVDVLDASAIGVLGVFVVEDDWFCA